MRLIDADKLLQELRKMEVFSLDGKDLFGGAARIAVFGRIGEQPTITSQNQWISVKDRLPEDEKPVLAYYGFYHDDSNEDLGARYIGTLTYFTYDPEPHWQHESTGLFVTHWMPLPKPPEE